MCLALDNFSVDLQLIAKYRESLVDQKWCHYGPPGKRSWRRGKREGKGVCRVFAVRVFVLLVGDLSGWKALISCLLLWLLSSTIPMKKENYYDS